MYANLDQLPANAAMFMIGVVAEPVGTPADRLWIEEIDVIAPRNSTVDEVIAAAKDDLDNMIDGARIVGVVNQSDGYVMWQDAESTRPAR